MQPNTQLAYLLSVILGEGNKQGTDEYYFGCPFCHHYKKKLAVNVAKRRWQCWKCGAKGRGIKSLVRKLDIPPHIKKDLYPILADEAPSTHSEPEEYVPVFLPSEYLPLWKPHKNPEYHHALKYLRDRGYSTPHILRYRLGYCIEGRYANRIIVPNYDETGNLNYFVARAFFDSGLKYNNPPVSKNVVGFEDMINWNEDLILVEGSFDAMAVGINAIPLYGKIIPRSLRTAIVEKKVRRIYIMLDPDATKEAVRQCEYLYKNGVDVRWVQLDEKDPGEMTKDEIFDKISTAIPMGFKNIVQAKLIGVT